MTRTTWSQLAILVAADSVLALTSYRLAFLIRESVPLPWTKELLPRSRFVQVDHHWLEILVLVVIAAYLLELYRDLPARPLRELLTASAAAAGLGALGLVSVYFFHADPVFPRSIVPTFWIFLGCSLFLVRLLALKLIRPPVSRVVLVGRTDTARLLIRDIEVSPRSFRQVVGVLREEGDDEPGDEFCGVPILGGLDAAAGLVERGEIDEILLAPAADWRNRLIGEIARLEGTGVRLNVAPSLYEILLGKLAHVNLRDRPVLEVLGPQRDTLQAAIKRTFDLILAFLIGLPVLVATPVLFLLVRFSSPGPFLYRQERVGQNGRMFVLAKLRTMFADAEADTGATLSIPDDPRVTPIGRFLRSTRLDELPQLWNVIRGEMSFVGPRPERPEFVAGFEETIAGYRHRHRVPPGLTGLAQVRGNYHTAPEVKLMYDLVYTYNQSLALDILILFETARTVLLSRGH